MKYDPYSEFSGRIIKSWDDGENSFFEGWLSTPRKDLEKDVTEPEAFIAPASEYFALRAPLSVQHGTDYLPTGHLQKAAIVRDGSVIKSFEHPTDSADFEYFPASGTGVWVRGVANEKPGRDALRKGNVGGMSFIASAKEKEPLPGGRWRYKSFSSWVESTIAAYPINPEAVIAVVKARGYEIPTQEETLDMSQIEEMIKKALADREAEKQQEQQAKSQETVTRAELGSLLAEFKDLVVEDVKKALPAPAPALEPRNEGTGRKGVVSGAQPDERDADPVSYLVKKAANGAEWDETDQALIAALTKQELARGLKADNEN